MIDIEGKCKMFGNDILYISVGSRKHPDRVIEWTGAKYEKAFNDALNDGILIINNVFIKWVSIEKDIKNDEVWSISNIVKITLIELNNSLAELVF